MSIIHKDKFGLWVAADGLVARPLSVQTRFFEGTRVKTYHFGGSTTAGIGKDSSCKRGQYLEEWTTTGLMIFELIQRKKMDGTILTDDMIEAINLYYKKYPNPRVHHSKAKQYTADRLKKIAQYPTLDTLFKRMRGEYWK